MVLEVAQVQKAASKSNMLILVDKNDDVVGFQEKEICHDGDGLLHRAFSVFLFDKSGKLLLQRRSHNKRLWGDFWSNSCCSHPRPHEETREAAENRIREELGVDARLHYLFKFEYRARYNNHGSENELCHVYAGLLDKEPLVNEFEVSAWRMISSQALDQELIEKPDVFTPWLKTEWPRLRENHWRAIETSLELRTGQPNETQDNTRTFS